MRIDPKDNDDREWVLPTAGMHKAICKSAHAKVCGGKYPGVKIRLVFQIEQRLDPDDPTSPRLCVFGNYGPTMRRDPKKNKASRLRELVERWLGDEYAVAAYESPWESEDLVGRTAQLYVKHNPDKSDPEKIWANIDFCLPLEGGVDMEAEFSDSEKERYAEDIAEAEAYIVAERNKVAPGPSTDTDGGGTDFNHPDIPSE